MGSIMCEGTGTDIWRSRGRTRGPEPSEEGYEGLRRIGWLAVSAGWDGPMVAEERADDVFDLDSGRRAATPRSPRADRFRLPVEAIGAIVEDPLGAGPRVEGRKGILDGGNIPPVPDIDGNPARVDADRDTDLQTLKAG